jgi:hypothetical protein
VPTLPAPSPAALLLLRRHACCCAGDRVSAVLQESQYVPHDALAGALARRQARRRLGANMFRTICRTILSGRLKP